MKTLYIIYDGRAIDEEGVQDATVCEICTSLKQAKSRAKEYGDGNCIWKETIDEETKKVVKSEFIKSVW